MVLLLLPFIIDAVSLLDDVLEIVLELFSNLECLLETLGVDEVLLAEAFLVLSEEILVQHINFSQLIAVAQLETHQHVEQRHLGTSRDEEDVLHLHQTNRC